MQPKVCRQANLPPPEQLMHHQVLNLIIFGSTSSAYSQSSLEGSQNLPHAFPEAALKMPAGKEGEERTIFFEYEPLESGISWENTNLEQ